MVAFIAGLLILLTGLILNYTGSQKGLLKLTEGIPISLALDQAAAAEDQPTDTLGLQISLDSMTVRPITPSYKLQVYETDSAAMSQPSGGSTGLMIPVDVFDLEPMKILKVGTSDFRFRLKAFFPNFTFAYTYPADRDTIQPIAPGITLELKRKKAEPLVATMLSDEPKRARLEDAVGLGASLAFFWEAPQDSIQRFAEKSKAGGPWVIFSEADSLVYFIREGMVDQKPLREQAYYPVSAPDSTGFTILHCFPDAAFLKAEPATRGSELLNPVAQIEYWPLGGRYQEAYVYPENSGKKGGEFAIPGTTYKIGLGMDRKEVLGQCVFYVSWRGEAGSEPERLQIKGGEAISVQGYTLTPIACKTNIPGTLMVQVSRSPGRIPVILGSLMAGLALLVFLIRRNTYISKADQ